MHEMKALVLAGGEGSRLESVTATRNKCMTECGGRPLIEYSLEHAARAGIGEIVIVVGYRAESIINRYGNRFDGTPVKYVIQTERRGLVHAIECAAETLDGADFTLLLADEVLIVEDHAKLIRTFCEQDVFALCGAVPVEDLTQIRKTYSIIHNEQSGQIYRLIEKPSTPLNNLMGTGNCVFKNRILEFIPQTPINQKRGEKELPDLIQCAIDTGQLVKLHVIEGKYFNINTPEDMELLAQNRLGRGAGPSKRA